MPQRETPEPWRTWMRDAGYTSLREVAADAAVGVSTVSRLVHGDGGTKRETIKAIATVLHLEEAVVAGQAGYAWGGTFVPADEAVFLNPSMQRAINDLIRSIAEATRQRPGEATVTPIPIQDDVPDLPMAARPKRKTDRHNPLGGSP